MLAYVDSFEIPHLKSNEPLTMLQKCWNCGNICGFKVDFDITKSENLLSKCWNCKKDIRFSVIGEKVGRQSHHRGYSSSNSGNETPKRPSIPNVAPHQTGSDAKPIDLTYYNLLNVAPDASPSAIKKAYYMAAMKNHPDKNPDDPQAEERFKNISEAYQVLSDPRKRSFYNQHGIHSQSDSVFMDPQQFFRQQFGGEKFVSLIGEISIARDFKDALNMANPDGSGSKESPLTADERKNQRQERVSDLVSHLVSKLALYTDAFPLSDPNDDAEMRTTMEHLSQEALNSFRILAQVEVDSLKQENYGVELLHAIGYTYTLKADQWIAAIQQQHGHIFSRTWSWTNKITAGLKEKAHIISETVGTVKTAYDLQASFTKLQEMESRRSANSSKGAFNDSNENGENPVQPLSQEDEELKAKLEQEAASKGMEALWRGSKLEVEAVVRDVCDACLGDEQWSEQVRLRRCIGLRVLGQVYQDVIKAD